MKISKSKLRQLIKEELARVLSESPQSQAGEADSYSNYLEIFELKKDLHKMIKDYQRQIYAIWKQINPKGAE